MRSLDFWVRSSLRNSKWATCARCVSRPCIAASARMYQFTVNHGLRASVFQSERRSTGGCVSRGEIKARTHRAEPRPSGEHFLTGRCAPPGNTKRINDFSESLHFPSPYSRASLLDAREIRRWTSGRIFVSFDVAGNWNYRRRVNAALPILFQNTRGRVTRGIDSGSFVKTLTDIRFSMYVLTFFLKLLFLRILRDIIIFYRCKFSKILKYN